MRIFLLAPLGALIACADGTGTYEDEETDYSGNQPSDEEDKAEQDLRGDYATCNDALVGLGFTPWTNYVEGETAERFEILGPEDEDSNPRPWIATLSLSENEQGYTITCTDFDYINAMWVVPDQEEYWVCTFQADKIGILDPDSDPDCSKGLSDEAIRTDAEEEENYRYNLAQPGLYVADEE